jgi:hypothetical protein
VRPEKLRCMTLRASAGALCAGALLAACAHRAPQPVAARAPQTIVSRTSPKPRAPVPAVPPRRKRRVAPPASTFPDLPSVPTEVPDARPEIIDVIVPGKVVTGGQTVTGAVIASSNVASVELRVAVFSRTMEKVAPGHFSITMRVPRLPFFLRNRSYAIAVIARNTRGDAVRKTVSVLVR